jgi:hypothetical protein
LFGVGLVFCGFGVVFFFFFWVVFFFVLYEKVWAWGERRRDPHTEGKKVIKNSKVKLFKKEK